MKISHAKKNVVTALQPLSSQREGSINNKLPELPETMIYEILANLPPSEDSNTALVCKLWNKVVQMLPDPSLQVIGLKIWNEYLGFEVEGKIPPLPKAIYATVRKDRKRLAGKKGAPTCTAILMPKGLTANKLIELAKNPKKGFNTELAYVFSEFVAKLCEEAVEESYWFVMTNDIIEGSRDKTYTKQQKLIKEKTNNQYEHPTFLEALANCVMHHVISGKHLLGKELRTLTYCQELNPESKSQIAIGGFGDLYVDDCFITNSSFCISVLRILRLDGVGAAACRKFL